MYHYILSVKIADGNHWGQVGSKCGQKSNLILLYYRHQVGGNRLPMQHTLDGRGRYVSNKLDLSKYSLASTYDAVKQLTSLDMGPWNLEQQFTS